MFDVFDRTTLETVDRVSAIDADDALDIVSKVSKRPIEDLIAVDLGFRLSDLPAMKLGDHGET